LTVLTNLPTRSAVVDRGVLLFMAGRLVSAEGFQTAGVMS
jgi:hypothetical protein